MRTDTIVGYSYRADIYCPEHIVGALKGRDDVAPAGFDMEAEHLLDQVAAYNLIDREDESSFDSDDFPKVAFRDQVRKLADCHEGDADTDHDLREIAAAWHGGQASALYSFASSGTVTDGASLEVSHCLREAAPNDVEALEALEALEAFFEECEAQADRCSSCGELLVT